MGRSRSGSRSPSRHKHKSKHSHKRSHSKDKRERSTKSKKSRSRERSRSRLSKLELNKLDNRHSQDGNKKRKRSSSSSSSSSDDLDGGYNSHRRRLKKMNEVERLAEMERLRRQKELESRLVEEETSKRIEEIVAKRVEEELEKRKDDIEKEVLRRVEEAKKIMEKQMLEEMERRQKLELEAQKAKEVIANAILKSTELCNATLPLKTSIPPPSLPANATPPFTNQIRSVVSNTQNIRPGIPVYTSATPPFLSNGQNAWTGVVVSGKIPTNIPRPSLPISTSSPPLNTTTIAARIAAAAAIEKTAAARQLLFEKKTPVQPGSTTATKTTVSYTMAVISPGKAPKTVSANIVSVATKVTASSDTKVSTINPISMERAGSAPPSSSVVHTQMTIGHSTCSGPSPVQPFTSNQSQKLANGSAITQHGTTVVQARIHVTQAPVSKPFLNSVVSTSQATVITTPPSPSPTGTLLVTSGQSAIAHEYSPFSNIFSKVAQSVWGQKDKETSKPNFASVAASGITSVASQIQNSNPVQSTLTLSLPQNSETELIVDAAKAPGYRGNLHISPSASSNSSASSNPPVGMSHSTNFGPIGSGPRSAPCTPPLGPIGPPSSVSSSTRLSTPPASQSPPPPGPHLSRSLPESQNPGINELQRSMAGGCSGLPPQHLSSQLSEAMFHHHGIGMSSHPSRLQSYPMASTLASPTNTTFSQNTPLSSVGNILPEGANNGSMQVVQSNLNPNAPDFSSRASLLMAQHGPPIHHMQRLPSGPTAFQENSVPPHLAAQFRPILASSGGMNPGFPIHPLASAQAQAAAVNRFSFHHVPNHQQQAEFNPNSATGAMGSVAGISQDADSLPLLSMVSGYHHPSGVVPGTGSIPHYPGMQAMMGIRPNHRSSSTTPSVGTSSKDEGSPMAAMSPSASPQGSNLSSPTGMSMQENPNPAGTIGEDRKLPRPIGMERAQRKNPMFGGVSDGGIWSFSSSGRSEIPVTQDWIHNMQNTIPSMQQQQDETGIPPTLHNYVGNRYPDLMPMENNHNIDQTYQALANSGYSFVNGLPPHLIASHLYQNNAATVGPGQVDGQIEMWNMHQKVPLSASADGLPQNVEHKLTWQNWSPHQA